MKLGFDNEKYQKIQSEHIKERISQFDEYSRMIEVQTHNTDLKKRLTAFAAKLPQCCRQTDDDEQGGLTFDIEKGRLSFAVQEAANSHAYECTANERSGEEALEQLRLNPDVRVALLDIMLPDMDGFEVCRRIRAGNSKIGIIMLTARTQEMDKVTGFMTGADDYVTKPFSPAELLARVRVALRHTRSGPGSGSIANTGKFTAGELTIDYDKHQVLIAGENCRLTQNEYKIVALLGKCAGKVSEENPDRG